VDTGPGGEATTLEVFLLANTSFSKDIRFVLDAGLLMVGCNGDAGIDINGLEGENVNCVVSDRVLLFGLR
jgi:hypothetical protein